MSSKTLLHQAGYSLIELMVAMVLGLVLMGGVFQIYMSSASSYRSVYELARMQETARIVFDAVTADIRGVGYWGCTAGASGINVANTVEDIAFDPFARGVEGWRVGQSNTAPPPRYSSREPIEGSDIIEFNFVDQLSGLTIQNHNGNAARIEFNNNVPFQVGDIMAIVQADCTNIGIFAITGPTNIGKNIVHNTGNHTPGNCTKNLSGNFNCSNESGNSSNTAYGAGSTVYQFTRRGYFIKAADTTPDTSALYVLNIGHKEAVSTVEVVQGVSALNIDYAVRVGDQTSYLDADEVRTGNLFGSVIGVRISVTVRSDAPIGSDGNRIERDYSTVVAVRNRL